MLIVTNIDKLCNGLTRKKLKFYSPLAYDIDVNMIL
jgi:hypothetical protein